MDSLTSAKSTARPQNVASILEREPAEAWDNRPKRRASLAEDLPRLAASARPCRQPRPQAEVRTPVSANAASLAQLGAQAKINPQRAGSLLSTHQSQCSGNNPFLALTQSSRPSLGIRRHGTDDTTVLNGSTVCRYIHVCYPFYYLQS